MSDSLILERVEANLTRLRLPRISQILQPVIKTAEEKRESHLAFRMNYSMKRLHKKNNVVWKRISEYPACRLLKALMSLILSSSPNLTGKK